MEKTQKLLEEAIERYNVAWERLKAGDPKNVKDYVERAGEATEAALAVADLQRNLHAQRTIARLRGQQGSEADGQKADQRDGESAHNGSGQGSDARSCGADEHAAAGECTEER